VSQHWLWFLAGGFTGLAVARALARRWRRLFWLAATAAFAITAMMLASPGSTSPRSFKTAWRAARAATEALAGVAAGFP
jgi:hypothetical protein